MRQELLCVSWGSSAGFDHKVIKHRQSDASSASDLVTEQFRTVGPRGPVRPETWLHPLRRAIDIKILLHLIQCRYALLPSSPRVQLNHSATMPILLREYWLPL